MKKYIALLWLCCLTVGIRAAVQIKAAAPDVVEEGEQFRLSFTVNTQDVSNFHLPTLKGLVWTWDRAVPHSPVSK